MTRISHVVAATALIGGLAIAGIASAQPMAGPRAGMDDPHAGMDMDGHGMGMDGHGRGHGIEIDFKAIDTDNNGSLSRAELMARATARIGTADTNADGSLDKAELIAALPMPSGALMGVFAESPAERVAERILAITGNTETGKVEVRVLAERRVNLLLATLDTDNDAAISQAEAEADMGHGWDGDRDHHRDGRRGKPDMMPGMMRDMMPDMPGKGPMPPADDADNG